VEAGAAEHADLGLRERRHDEARFAGRISGGRQAVLATSDLATSVLAAGLPSDEAAFVPPVPPVSPFEPDLSPPLFSAAPAFSPDESPFSAPALAGVDSVRPAPRLSV